MIGWLHKLREKAMLIYRGMGATAMQEASVATGTAASTVSLLSSSLIGILPGIAGPIGAVIAGVVSLLTALGVGQGCGNTCIQASNDANQVGNAMAANLSAFLAGQISQATAIANFNSLWQQLETACGQVSGSAGQNCISQRQEGACYFKSSPGGWQQNADGTWSYQYPGANGSGDACWNYFVGFLDPIQNAPAGAIPPTAATLLSDTPLLVGAGVLLLGLLV